MFFTLSKVASFVVLPSNLCLIVCVVGVVLLLRWPWLGRRVLVAGVCLLIVFGVSPISNFLLLPLTERFPAWTTDGPAPDGIVVLGGVIDPRVSQARGAVELNAGGERVVAMLALARTYPDARVLYTGGSASLVPGAPAEAPQAGVLLDQFGVGKDRIILDAVSRTTAENAEIAFKLAAPKPGERWLLVTSAYHMPRSIGAFRAVGFNVEAYPVDWRVRGWRDAFRPFTRPSDGLARSDAAVHEWIGLITYWLTGRSSALLPAPDR